MKKIYSTLFALTVLFSGLNAQTTWDNFEDSRKGTYGFIAGTFIPYNENPDQSGANTSLVAAEYTRNPAELFDVIIIDALMADLSDYVAGEKQISIDVWSPSAGIPIQITLENSVTALPENFPTGRHSVYLTETTVANEWETLTFSFDNQPDPGVSDTDVDRLVLLFNPETNTGDTYYWDNLNAPELANDPCEGVETDEGILNDYECQQNVNYVFSHAGVNYRRVENPDQTGNESDYVATYTRNGGEEFDVIIGRFDGALNLSSTSMMTLDVWDPAPPTTVTLSLQNLAGDVILAMDATTSESATWETLTYDPSSVFEATDIEQFVILFDPESFSSNQYYMDNFTVSGITSANDVEFIEEFVAFPNPTTDVATIRYNLKQSSDVNYTLTDITGRVIENRLFANQAAGLQQFDINTQGLSDGIYLYNLIVNGKSVTGRIAVTR